MTEKHQAPIFRYGVKSNYLTFSIDSDIIYLAEG